MADDHGATSSAAFAITITGTNDAPNAVQDDNAGQVVKVATLAPGRSVGDRQRADQ